MRAIFDQELEQIGDDLLDMARHVATAISDASTALQTSDLELAEQVIEADAKIDELEAVLDERCITLLARQQPVATDLRIIISALRISSSIERMGDLARHVGQVVRLRYPQQAVPDAAMPLYRELATASIKVANDIVELLQNHDLELAAAVERDDDVLDQLHAQTFQLTLADDWPGSPAETVDLTLLARFYERFGDHAVAVARRITYLVTGDTAAGSGNADG